MPFDRGARAEQDGFANRPFFTMVCKTVLLTTACQTLLPGSALAWRVRLGRLTYTPLPFSFSLRGGGGCTFRGGTTTWGGIGRSTCIGMTGAAGGGWA